MTREKYSEITIHLDNVHDLFTTPTGDPFSAKANFVSGIELIKNEFKSRSWGLEERTRKQACNDHAPAASAHGAAGWRPVSGGWALLNPFSGESNGFASVSQRVHQQWV